MKLHFVLVQAVADALLEIFQQGKYADKVIEKALRADRNRGARDRAFIAETTYNCVRWWRRLWYLKTGQQEIQPLFSTQDLIHLIGIQLITQNVELPDWAVFKPLDRTKILLDLQQLNERKIKWSIPDWLDEKGVLELDTNWDSLLEKLNMYAEVALRTNLLKTDTISLQERLAKEGFEAVAVTEIGLVLRKRGNVFNSECFKLGHFEVQDIGSQEIAPFLQVEAGMRVIDACAGAGGKTLHLATLMQNKGKIIALDTEAWKLEELKKRAQRNGVAIVETRCIDSNKVIKRLHASADRLLLDVPCSGMGVLRRNPDAKWKLSPKFMQQIVQTQQQILQQYAKMLCKGGKLVYATCSIFPSENQQQIELFLQQNSDFKFLKEKTISPLLGYDGFYMALLERRF